MVDPIVHETRKSIAQQSIPARPLALSATRTAPILAKDNPRALKSRRVEFATSVRLTSSSCPILAARFPHLAVD